MTENRNRIQYFSRRLNEEFVDIQSCQRGWKGQCAQCKTDAVTIYSINFGAAFCRPGCYIEFNKGFVEAMNKEGMVDYDD